MWNNYDFTLGSHPSAMPMDIGMEVMPDNLFGVQPTYLSEKEESKDSGLSSSFSIEDFFADCSSTIESAPALPANPKTNPIPNSNNNSKKSSSESSSNNNKNNNPNVKSRNLINAPQEFRKHQVQQPQSQQYQQNQRQAHPNSLPPSAWRGFPSEGIPFRNPKVEPQGGHLSSFAPSTYANGRHTNVGNPQSQHRTKELGSNSNVLDLNVSKERSGPGSGDEDRKRKRRRYVRQEDVRPTPVTLPRQKLLTMTLVEMDEYVKKMTSTRKLTDDEEQDLKRQRRLVKNRESALASRNRKKEDMEHLEEQVNSLTEESTAQKKKISELESENESLRSQLKSLSQLLTGTPSLEISPKSPSTQKNVSSKESSVARVSSSKVGASVTMMVLLVSVGSMIPSLDENKSQSSLPLPYVTESPPVAKDGELGTPKKELVLRGSISLVENVEQDDRNPVVQIVSTPAAASVVSAPADDASPEEAHSPDQNTKMADMPNEQIPAEAEDEPLLIQVYVPRSALSQNNDIGECTATIATPPSSPATPVSPPATPESPQAKAVFSSPRKAVPNMEVSCRIVNVEAPSLDGSSIESNSAAL